VNGRQQVRGREASHPGQIPAKGWKDILFRVKDSITHDRVSLVAAGVAFYTLLAIFPAITATISIAGLVTDPASLARQLDGLTEFLPADAAEIISSQATSVAGAAGTGLGLAAFFGIAVALWSTSRGVASMIEALNVAYDEREERGFIKLILFNLMLTVGMILSLFLVIGILIALPIIVRMLNLPEVAQQLVTLARWPILALFVVVGLAILYRWGPCRRTAEWRWITPGAIVATVLWILASIGFSVYVSNFGNYNETFGTLGGVIVLLTWFWLSCFIVLLGAELNAEIEAQIEEDTTTGKDRPMGKRGADKADHLGEAKG
jgi:membrane protein